MVLTVERVKDADCRDTMAWITSDTWPQTERQRERETDI